MKINPPYDSGLQSVGHLVGDVDVPGHDASSQPVSGSIGPLDDFVAGLELEYVLYRTEYFLLGNRHVVPDVGEDRGFDEVAPVPDATSAVLELGAFTLSTFDVLQDALHLSLAHLPEKTKK